MALLALVLYVRPHITMVAELFKHAGACLTRHPGLLLQPVITFFVLLAFFLFWVWVLMSLATASKLFSCLVVVVFEYVSRLACKRKKGIFQCYRAFIVKQDDSFEIYLPSLYLCQHGKVFMPFI